MKKLFLLIFFSISLFGQVYQTESFSDALGDYFQKQNWYGVKYNYASDSFTRTGTLKNEAIATKPSEVLLTVHNKIRRCVINDAGVRQYYLDRNNSYLQENGDSAKVDGTDGMVMVEFPKFYYKYSISGTEYEWNISLENISGFTVHPAFVDSGGVEKDFVYIGAFAGVLYDASAGAYLDASSSSIYASGDKLASIVGYKPSTGETRAEYRVASTARGAGWHQLSHELLSMVQLLFITEYASFNSQTMISEGNNKFSTWDYNTRIAPTGKSLLDGDYSNGQSTVGGDSLDYVSYRGLEDFWGNVWQFVDGININNDGVSSKLYVTNDYRYFLDNTSTNYTFIGNLANTDGYIKRIINYETGFYPSIIGGASNTYLADYYYTDYNTSPSGGWRVFRVGGYAPYGVKAGVFVGTSDSASSFAGSGVGGRLCFSGSN